ncbi:MULTISPECIES: ABC transporter ATP-binding protein [Bradyrhizobium]|jgi:ATP-binding cassette, subfamily B, bacterial|uniref:Multidrug ABC transporter ATP-binding protein n=1 Tax=Bradyrhizobium diazoefficiens TaxID=1355477 RepID=A0A809XV46_9BRAD|nr:ABC transporter ATP-binding protein [Bradyrhizobium diazoefficiens]AWO92231.1 ABC transporter ATP-binding protein [Bradyrhizobium diazoefficiens]BCA05182.1 multidrug ABC transporter ATP-binding protein [Bradyrhizobium diazoefficiens]BCA22537.1 multidrug ABC transporter ATP-binding protein [Bradyrhizobium diazoefficiens]BCE31912.1 multidrug ABC transporter ATP-binding protein [Bradyrhizobium diazoefficiens]BCE40697.1 multidrug ABC transporter ATP-binding protein [Bradyrhizobium diazoefficien
MASKPPSPDKQKPPVEEAAELDKLAPTAKPDLEDDEDDEGEEDDELELDDDDEDEDLVVFTAREAAGALATILGFVKPYLANYKRMLSFVAFGVVVETLFNVIMPLSLKFLIDDALGEEDFQALYKILGVLAAAGIFTSIVAVWYERWDARLAACIISDVRKHLFEHVQDLPAAYFGRTKRGEILSRFSVDLAAFEGSVKTFANSAALPFLELFAGIILMVFLNWQLAVVALLVFPITLIGPRMLTPKAVQANYEQKLNESALLGMVQENVAAQAVIKAFSLQRRMFGFFTFRNDETRNRIASAAFLSTMVERTVTISVLLLHLVVLAIGAYLATKGQITIGTFVTFESAFWEVSYNIAHVMHFIPVSISSAAAIRHIQELLDEPTRGADRAGAPDLPRITHDITFDRVTFQYEGSQTPVLDNLSLKLNVGKSIAIVGPSGSGKSTLLNLILRLYVPDEGRVTIDGVDVRKVTLDSLRRSMAVVFQENMLFNMSIRENIRLGKEGATDAEVEEAAKKAEIHRYIMSLPQRYDTPVGERGDTLSGGQRQRIAIARAIIRNPSVLLLDEATSALDQTTEAAINRTLLKVAKGRTMIWSTHRLTSVVEMDEIIVISGGRAIERGSHAELLARNGTYRKLWNDQIHQPHGAVAQADDDSDDDEDEDDLEGDEDEDDEEE